MSLIGKSLYVMTPMYGGNLTFNYHNSFVQLAYLCKDLGIELAAGNIYNESLISRARNRLVDMYLKQHNSTHAVFIDADIGFDPRDIIKMMDLDKDILGVPCSKKAIRWDRVQNAVAKRVLQWVAGTSRNGHDPDALFEMLKKSGALITPAELSTIAGDFVLNFPPSWKQELNLDEPSTEEMKHLGTGLLMVKRGVFEKFKKCYPDRWYEAKADPNTTGPIHDFFKVGINPESREYDSEDYWFCHDCIALGYKVLMCPWIKTDHMGSYLYVGDMKAAVLYTNELF